MKARKEPNIHITVINQESEIAALDQSLLWIMIRNERRDMYSQPSEPSLKSTTHAGSSMSCLDSHDLALCALQRQFSNVISSFRCENFRVLTNHGPIESLAVPSRNPNFATSNPGASAQHVYICLDRIYSPIRQPITS